MSIIGKKVGYEFPVDNDTTQTGSGVVLDKFRNSFVNDTGQVMSYDTYMIQGEDNKIQSVHPTLITEMLE